MALRCVIEHDLPVAVLVLPVVYDVPKKEDAGRIDSSKCGERQRVPGIEETTRTP